MIRRIRHAILVLLFASIMGCESQTGSQEQIVPPEAGGMTSSQLENDLAEQAKMSQELTKTSDDTIIVH